MIRKSAGEVASCKRLCETGLEKQPVLQPVLALKRVVENQPNDDAVNPLERRDLTRYEGPVAQWLEQGTHNGKESHFAQFCVHVHRSAKIYISYFKSVAYDQRSARIGAR